ncbi:MAG TPA: PspC domain-containing protein [Nocardioides sp.]|nr:PspC domain-containing protein [Nocardioides sp.]
MTQNPPEAPAEHPSDPGGHAGPDDGPRVTRDEVRDLGRLRRSRGDRKIAGVAGGLARHLDIDPIILRVALVVLIFFGGAGLLIYVAIWLLVPEEDTNQAKVRLDDRSRGVALIIVGAIAALAVIGDSMGDWGFPWPLAILGLIALVIVSVRGDSRPPQPVPTHPTPGVTFPGAGQPGAPATSIPPPRNPKKRGPILFWWTMALTALAIGLLGIVDLAGGPVTDSAYPAVALGLSGVMLLIGAFYGRAGGLIAFGLLAATATAGATAAHEVDAGKIEASPVVAADVDDTYELFAGKIDLDLSDVRDIENLDGRHIDVEAVFGQIVVTVPDDVDVEVDADVDGGETRLFGEDESHSNSSRHSARTVGAPVLTIDIELALGEITVDTEERIDR